MIARPLRPSQASTELPDWVHQSEENRDFRTFGHLCGASGLLCNTRVPEQQQAGVVFFLFLDTNTWTDAQRPLLCGAGVREE